MNDAVKQVDDRIGVGAEAVVTRTERGIIKARSVKGYRHHRLDMQLRKNRTRSEARLLEKAKLGGVNVPDVAVIDETTLLLSEAPGVPVKDALDTDPLIAHTIGRIVAKLHSLNIVHADLTTSNMLYDSATQRVTLIDFGLSYSSVRDEDMAVDLHLFRQSIESKHHAVAALAYRHFLKGYRDTTRNADAIIARLRKVEARGRNKGS